jgi:hypothetical protein
MKIIMMCRDLPKNGKGGRSPSPGKLGARQRAAAPANKKQQQQQEHQPSKKAQQQPAPPLRSSAVKQRPAERVKTRHSSIESDGNSSLNSIGRCAFLFFKDMLFSVL